MSGRVRGGGTRGRRRSEKELTSSSTLLPSDAPSLFPFNTSSTSPCHFPGLSQTFIDQLLRSPTSRVLVPRRSLHLEARVLTSFTILPSSLSDSTTPVRRDVFSSSVGTKTKTNSNLPFSASNLWLVLSPPSQLRFSRSSHLSLSRFCHQFNARYKYPYCLLSDTPFKASFLASLRTVLHEGAVIHTGLVTHEQGWGMPDWMDKEEARRKMKAMGKSGVQYGEKESYRECRD